MIHFVQVWCVIVFLVMVPKYVIDVSIIWLNGNIYSRNTWFPTTDVQTQNIGKLRYANRRAPTECQHTVATQATEYQRWRDVGFRSRRCRLMPTLGQRRNASWALLQLDNTASKIDGLMLERRNSSVLAMALRLTCTNPSRWEGHRGDYFMVINGTDGITDRLLCLQW